MVPTQCSSPSRVGLGQYPTRGTENRRGATRRRAKGIGGRVCLGVPRGSCPPGGNWVAGPATSAQDLLDPRVYITGWETKPGVERRVRLGGGRPARSGYQRHGYLRRRGLGEKATVIPRGSPRVGVPGALPLPRGRFSTPGVTRGKRGSNARRVGFVRPFVPPRGAFLKRADPAYPALGADQRGLETARRRYDFNAAWMGVHGNPSGSALAGRSALPLVFSPSR